MLLALSLNLGMGFSEQSAEEERRYLKVESVSENVVEDVVEPVN